MLIYTSAYRAYFSGYLISHNSTLIYDVVKMIYAILLLPYKKVITSAKSVKL